MKKRGPSPWTAAERTVLRTLRQPEDVQRFIDEFPYNEEDAGERCRSPRSVEPVAFVQGLLPGQTHPPSERLGS